MWKFAPLLLVAAASAQIVRFPCTIRRTTSLTRNDAEIVCAAIPGGYYVSARGQFDSPDNDYWRACQSTLNTQCDFEGGRQQGPSGPFGYDWQSLTNDLYYLRIGCANTFQRCRFNVMLDVGYAKDGEEKITTWSSGIVSLEPSEQLPSDPQFADPQ
mmetsp:Transcript_3203/g.3830  ORF Transcript_3203/g.3830 Transcript_3203/m.3830 type:complete len:157 (+) Transcript_3203:27-497(+)|eukprot:CAMPEP_0205824504 /NCGR_PEP_ID=MMETSP0206-20130828/21342_1 /ASSEMBLY_ACC=CAM_ASM_000279 /TAXON_ID=36767 /ORGANISM="Euplotes focardii, Strain TN1" /LENGTH=156 /DNA_ID=CAMNT_0053122713 /DNA_START=25 /DNA_END=495 /DNA_ORIENTATION=+